METCFYVISNTVQDRYLNVGAREVYFNRAGHSAGLTEAEFKRLLTISGFVAADGPPHVDTEVDAATGTVSCPFCAGRGRVAADAEWTVAVGDEEDEMVEDLGDAPTLDLEYESPEPAEDETLIAYPPPAEVPLPFTLSDEEIVAWQLVGVERRISFVEETNFDAAQLIRLFNAEAAGKNSRRVLEAIDTLRNKVVENRDAFGVNAALIASNLPTATEE